jgi:hypothetical protein
VLDVDYFNKKTNNAYDFNALLNTSIAFPIAWQKSKLDGVSFKLNLANYKGLTAFTTAGHTRARFFHPRQVDYSSIPIYRPASSASTTIKTSSKPLRFNINSNAGRSCFPTSTSLGATTAAPLPVR